MKLINTYDSLIKSTTLKERSKINVFVGLSGGVDSSVTAYLLKKAGFKVTGVYMLCFDSGEPDCKAKTDRADAIKVAGFLNIPIQVWDMQKEYKAVVIDYFFTEFKKGLTPNPDILCNSEIKFGLFLKTALKNKADYVATGHYAQIFNLANSKHETLSSKHNFLASGKDVSKDQSYFLSKVGSENFSKMLFPLGSTLKKDNRKIASKIKLPVAKKPDSTGICFLEDVDVQDFLRTQIKEKQGVVKNLSGEAIGTHKGVWFYTIGQRHGFSVNKYTGKPSFVVSKNVDENILVVSGKEALESKELKIKNYELRVNLNMVPKHETFIRIRNLGNFVPISNIKERGKHLKIDLSKSVSSVAPGQFACIYLKLGRQMVVIGQGVLV